MWIQVKFRLCRQLTVYRQGFQKESQREKTHYRPSVMLQSGVTPLSIEFNREIITGSEACKHSPILVS